MRSFNISAAHMTLFDPIDVISSGVLEPFGDSLDLTNVQRPDDCSTEGQKETVGVRSGVALFDKSKFVVGSNQQTQPTDASNLVLQAQVKLSF